MKLSRIVLNPKHLTVGLLALLATTQASFARTVNEFNASFNQTYDNSELACPTHRENNHFRCGSGDTDLWASYTENLNLTNVAFNGSELLFTLVVYGNCHDIDARQTLNFGLWKDVHRMDIRGRGCITSTLPLRVLLPSFFRTEIKKTGDATFVTKFNPETLAIITPSVQTTIADALKISIDQFAGPIAGLEYVNLFGADRATLDGQLKGNVYQARIVQAVMAKFNEILASEISCNAERSLDFLNGEDWVAAIFERDNNQFILTVRN